MKWVKTNFAFIFLGIQKALLMTIYEKSEVCIRKSSSVVSLLELIFERINLPSWHPFALSGMQP